jgi:hypothetical protein
MSKIVARLKQDDLYLKNNINERLPTILNGLTTYYPFDYSLNQYIPGQIRYIRDYLDGNTSNDGNHWLEIRAIDYNDNNVALNKPVTSNDSSPTRIGKVTDGTTSNGSYCSIYGSPSWVQVDLEKQYNLKEIKIWHYNSDGRTYHNTKIEVSVDGEHWFPIFNSAIEGEYPETPQGHNINLLDLGETCSPISYNNITQTPNGIAIEESTQNLIGNGDFSNSNHIENASRHQNSEYFEIITNPIKTIPYDYVLKFNSTSGATCEYEIHKKDGINLSPGKYTLSLWAYVSEDYDGSEQLLHSKWRGDSEKSTIGGFPNKREQWEKISLTVDLSSWSTLNTFNWYVGYPQRSNNGYILVTGLQVEKKSFKTSFTDNKQVLELDNINNSVPYDTTYDNGNKYYFDLKNNQSCKIVVNATDAEGGFHIGINGNDLGTMSGANNETKNYTFDVTSDKLKIGRNEISVWCSWADGGNVNSIIIEQERFNNSDLILPTTINNSNFTIGFEVNNPVFNYDNDKCWISFSDQVESEYINIFNGYRYDFYIGDNNNRTHYHLNHFYYNKNDKIFFIIQRNNTTIKIQIFKNNNKVYEDNISDSNYNFSIDKIKLGDGIGNEKNNLANAYFKNLSIYNKILSNKEILSLVNSTFNLNKYGEIKLNKGNEHKDYLRRHLKSSFFDHGDFIDGWGRRNWDDSSGTLQGDTIPSSQYGTYRLGHKYSYFIWQRPNFTESTGNWCGIKLELPDQVKKPGKWRISFYYKGYSNKNLSIYTAYKSGHVSWNGLGESFLFSLDKNNIKEDKWKKFEYIYNLTENDIYKMGDGTDGGEEKLYDCMRRLRIGLNHGPTDSRGNRVFIDDVKIEKIDQEKGLIDKDKNYFNEIYDGNKLNKIYLRGTSLDDGGVNCNGDRIVEVNGNTIVKNSSRGLRLDIFDKNMNHIFNQQYDTYDTIQDRDDLANKLNTITKNQYFCITSYDASLTNSNLTFQMEKMGSKIFYDIHTTDDHRITYAAFGKGQDIIKEDGCSSQAFDKHRAIVQITI